MKAKKWRIRRCLWNCSMLWRLTVKFGRSLNAGASPFFSANSEKVVQQVLDELGLTLTDEVTPLHGLPKLIISSYHEEMPGRRLVPLQNVFLFSKIFLICSLFNIIIFLPSSPTVNIPLQRKLLYVPLLPAIFFPCCPKPLVHASEMQG